MAWAKIDDQLDDHDKFVGMSSAAAGQWLFGIAYASRKLTDGFLPLARVRSLILGRGEDLDAITGELVASGLWDVVEGGFNIHDYLLYNPSREAVLAQREARIESGKKGAQARWGSHDQPESMAHPIDTTIDTTIDTPIDTHIDQGWQKDAPVSRNPLPVTLNPKPTPEPEGKQYTGLFESWWKFWPKRGDTKSKAFTAWERLNSDDRDSARSGLGKWLPYYASLENRLIPDASTWINQSRWENDPPPIQTMNSNGRVTNDDIDHWVADLQQQKGIV